ncbi:hypothetical protein J1614_005824 [Plenodomus biglobosus]|nr:hypothetical protein J1614_005824 [Plenodomus biglobosus]
MRGRARRRASDEWNAFVCIVLRSNRTELTEGASKLLLAVAGATTQADLIVRRSNQQLLHTTETPQLGNDQYRNSSNQSARDEVVRHGQTYVSAEDHERALDKIAKLSRDIDARINEAELAGKACRDLATWTINERLKLQQDREIARSNAARKIEAAVNRERELCSTALGEILELEIGKARAEIGLAPLSTEKMQACLEKAKAGYKQSVNMADWEMLNSSWAAEAVEDAQVRPGLTKSTPSIMDQVDGLLAQEGRNLPAAE